MQIMMIFSCGYTTKTTETLKGLGEEKKMIWEEKIFGTAFAFSRKCGNAKVFSSECKVSPHLVQICMSRSTREWVPWKKTRGRKLKCHGCFNKCVLALSANVVALSNAISFKTAVIHTTTNRIKLCQIHVHLCGFQCHSLPRQQHRKNS